WYGLSFGLMLSIEVVLSIIFATIFMFQISPRLSILALVTLPIIGFLALRLEKSIGFTFGQISEQNAKLNTIAQENIAGVRLVKAFARERHEINKFLKHNKEYYDLNVHQSRVWSKFNPKLEFLTSILPILLVAFGGAFVIREEMTIGTLIKFSGYMYMIVWPMRNIGWLSNIMAEAGASSKKIALIFDQKSQINNSPNPVTLDKFDGNIEFKNVSFDVGDTEVLKDISFIIKPGKTLAIMGETGSGKSTIMNLLIRFYDKTSGDILINDVKIEDMELKSLRKNISVVMQDTFLFSDTIEENIKFGSKEFITTNDMQDCSKTAESHEFVSRMEEDYQTVIGEKGIGLSGGQKQRISIARALAKNASVLVFDDSTSSLDMETEFRIQRKIEELKDVTKIIIAHRISAVKKADEIIILEKGAIVERGTHKELLSQKGRYYETFMEQYEGVNESLHLA
ncbi:MAG: ABC transporter ATP-binding protein, partial [Vallitaleaceae bacterium]|nr:ABC transporter ATP-binding protein [Vallitaleaceae bacterium]